MSSGSLYAQVVPSFVEKLKATLNLLDKAEAHAEAKKIPADVFMTSRIIADMESVSYQIRTLINITKFPEHHLTGKPGVPVPKGEDCRLTMTEARDLIKARLADLEAIDEATYPPLKDEKIEVIMYNVDGPHFYFNNVQDYATQMVLGNLLFHYSTLYLILRQNGVAIGKRELFHEIDVSFGPRT